MNAAVLEWLLGRDTGSSSEAIVHHMEGVGLSHGLTLNVGGRYPDDPSDLGRCIRLLEIAPEYRTRLGEMADESPEWARLVAHWGELEALYRQEEPSGRAPKCYDRMRELIGKPAPLSYWEKDVT